MDPIDGMLFGFSIVILLSILGAIVFTLFIFLMYIHGVIRTVNMWPEESIFNVVMLILMLVVPGIGAIVYFFVCYQKSSVLKNS